MFGVGMGVAPSAGDPTAYLGPETGATRTNPYDRVNHTNYDYPEAVKNQTLFVKQSLTGFIMEGIEWMTTLALPWAETAQVSVTWDEWHFTSPLADRVPHEGISRLITSTKRQFKTHVVRRGLAFVQEADYANTPEGMEQYALNVMSIGQAVQETQNHDTVYALLTCKNYEKLWMQRFGTARVSISQVEDNEIETFGSVCLPEGDDRLSVLIEDHKRLMAKQGVKPNMLILWPGSTIYMSMVPPMRTEYEKAGPQGVLRRERGPDSLTVFRGLPVFEARDFDVNDDSVPVQLLTRPVQIAEYYTMRFNRNGENVSDYTTKERSIVIYNENANEWKKIGMIEAFEHANVFNSAGTYSRKLHDLIAHYHARGQRPAIENLSEDATVDEEMEDADHEDAGNGHPPSFFLTTPDNDGEYMLLRYFGQMEMQHMTPTQVERIGETIAAHMHGVSLDAWRDMVRLVGEIETQPYDETYAAALIAANTAASVNSAGQFVGELTPSDLMEHWGLPVQQRQWKANAYGSLDLPQDASMASLAFPAGYANGPGLQTLAAEAVKPGSPWRAAGMRAARSVEMLQHMLDVLRMTMPKSASIDSHGRSPWFHRDNALATFFESVIGVSRDPLFMASLPAVDAANLRPTLSDQPPAVGSASRDVPWFVLPGTLYDVAPTELQTGPPDAITAAIKGDRKAAGVAGLRRASPPATTGAGGNVTFYSPTTGGDVTVAVDDFDSVVRFTPEVRAYGMMPGGSDEASQRIRQAYHSAVASIDNAETRRKLISFVFNMGMTRNRVKMWRAVYGMRQLEGAELEQAVNTVYLGDSPSADDTARANAKVRELSEGAPSEASLKGVEVLSASWTDLKTTTLSSSPISYQAAADDVQTVLDMRRELLAKSDLDRSSDVFDATAVAAATATAGNASRVAELKASLGAAIARVRSVLTSDATRGNAVRRSGGGGGGSASVSVSEAPEDVLNANYYRTPLTSSLYFVQSISDAFSQSGVAKPLLLPGDPSTNNTMPYAWSRTDGASSSGTFGRSNYNPLPISSAVGAAMRATNYSTIAEVLSDGSKRRLDDTGFIKRHLTAQFTGAPSGMTAPAEHMHFDEDDDDDYDSEDDDIAQIFGGSSSSAAASAKRARTGAALIGAHASSSVCGPTDSDSDTMLHRASHKLTRTPTFAKRWAQASNIANPLVRVCAHVFLMTNCEQASTWKMMIENDILTPMDFDLYRPNIVHDMASAILMKGGINTGANLHGGANVSKSNDGISKLIYYNFTFRSKAVVWEQKNVIIIENIKFEGYVGGMNCRFIKNCHDLDDESRDRPSIIVVALPINEKQPAKRMDFSGKSGIPETNSHIDGKPSYSYSSAEYYDKLVYKLSSRESGKPPAHEDFFDRAERVTLAAYQGHEFKYNRTSRSYSQFIQPQGHMKRGMNYPGAASVLNGTAKSFQPYAYDQVRIE